MTYTFEPIYDASAFHMRVYESATGTLTVGACLTAVSIWFLALLSKNEEARRRFNAMPRARLSLLAISSLGTFLLIVGGRSLSLAIGRAHGVAADLQSPRALTVEGVVSAYVRNDLYGNARPTSFAIDGLLFAYDWNSETFNATVQQYGPIYDGRYVRITYMPPPPGQPITEILRVAVGTPTG